MSRLEGANCADLPGFVIDKYFGCNVGREPLLAKVAIAICENCVVMTECRDAALNQPKLQSSGVIGGVTAAEIHRARRWHNYELGFAPKPPPDGKRPTWLHIPDAAERVEQGRLEDDPDE